MTDATLETVAEHILSTILDAEDTSAFLNARAVAALGRECTGEDDGEYWEASTAATNELLDKVRELNNAGYEATAARH